MEFGRPELIWAIINFVILLGVLTWILYRPVIKLLDGRAEEIEGRLARAEKAQKEAQETEKKLAAQLAQAEVQAREILDRAARQAEAARRETVGQAREEAERLLQRAQEAIAREKDRAVAELREEVAGLATMAAGRIIEKTLSPDDHRHLVDEVVSEIGARKS